MRITIDEAKKKITKLLEDAHDGYLWGGGEDENGSLSAGPVDFDELEKHIFEIIEKLKC